LCSMSRWKDPVNTRIPATKQMMRVTADHAYLEVEFELPCAPGPGPCPLPADCGSVLFVRASPEAALAWTA
jgi:hypothetical protein